MACAIRVHACLANLLSADRRAACVQQCSWSYIQYWCQSHIDDITVVLLCLISVLKRMSSKLIRHSNTTALARDCIHLPSTMKHIHEHGNRQELRMCADDGTTGCMKILN